MSFSQFESSGIASLHPEDDNPEAERSRGQMRPECSSAQEPWQVRLVFEVLNGRLLQVVVRPSFNDRTRAWIDVHV